MTNIASPKMIASRITDKIGLSEKSDEQISRESGVQISKFYRWKAGQIPKSCTDLVRLGITLNIEPNALFLQDWTPKADEKRLTVEDQQHIAQAAEIIAELSENLEGPDRPAALLLDVLEGMRRRRRSMKSAQSSQPSQSAK